MDIDQHTTDFLKKVEDFAQERGTSSASVFRKATNDARRFDRFNRRIASLKADMKAVQSLMDQGVLEDKKPET